MNSTGNRIGDDSRGAVYLEYIVAGVPIFFTFLAVVQLCLIAMAGLVVKHAAWTAARAAIVVLPDGAGDLGVNGNGCSSNSGPGGHKADSSRSVGYGNSRRWNPNSGKPGSTSQWDQGSYGQDNCFDPLYKWMEEAAQGGTVQGYDQGGSATNIRVQNIVAAAVAKTAAVSPALDTLKGQQGNSVKNAFAGSDKNLGDGTFDDDGPLARKVNYAKAATAVSITVNNVPDAPTVTAQVGYYFRCAIPVVDQWVCNAGCTGFAAGFRTIDNTGKVCNGATGAFRVLYGDATLPLPRRPLWIPGEFYP
jgi:hypothetical protein